MNAPLFGHIYIPWVNQPALNVAFMLGSRSLKPLMFQRAAIQQEVLLGLAYIHHFPGQLLSCRRSAGGT